MTVKQIAQLHDVTEETVRRWILNRGLKATKKRAGVKGQPYDVHPEDLKKWCVDKGLEVRV